MLCTFPKGNMLCKITLHTAPLYSLYYMHVSNVLPICIWVKCSVLSRQHDAANLTAILQNSVGLIVHSINWNRNRIVVDSYPTVTDYSFSRHLIDSYPKPCQSCLSWSYITQTSQETGNRLEVFLFKNFIQNLHLST